ncbi:hypothetical protein E3O48_14040, partial [Cryobacterium sp. HLT2-28]
MVVEPAEHDAVVDVGEAAGPPGDDVVEFGPVGWGGAAGDDAAAVAGGDGAALRAVEEAFVQAEAEHFLVGAEEHGLGAAGAEALLHGGEVDRGGDSVDPADAGAGLQVGGVHVHKHG